MRWSAWVVAALGLAGRAWGAELGDEGRPPLDDGMLVVPAPPRPLAPLSTARVTSNRPLLRWERSANASTTWVELCRDRACAQLVERISTSGSSARPSAALASGVYYWRLRGVSGPLVSDPGPVWELQVRASPASSVAPPASVPGFVFDVNGDGYADLAAGRSASNSAYVFHGGAVGISSAPAIVLTGPASAGNTVANVGDVNGDGYADLAVAAVTNGSSIIVYPGSASGIQPNGTALQSGGAILWGTTIAPAGDVNGDGYGDIIVGTRYGALLYLGSASGIVTTAARVVSGPGSAGSYVTAGDFNGDGYGDVVVSTPNQGASVYLGGAGGLAASASLVTSGGACALTAGDVNGDGYSDLVIQGSGTTVRLGGPNGLGPQSAPIAAPSGNLVTLDVNGDGYADLAAGNFNSSAASVFLGSANGLAPSPAMTISGPASSRFGDGLASGDTNRDGYDDLLVGASSAGKVFVYSGSATGLASSPSVTLSGLGAGSQWLASRARLPELDAKFLVPGARRRSGRAGRA